MMWMGIWVHPYIVTLVQVGVDVTLVQVGVDFENIYVGPGLSDVARSWLRLKTPVDCIPHPCHVYTMSFSTLIRNGWAYGCTLTLLCLCRWGWILGQYMQGQAKAML